MQSLLPWQSDKKYIFCVCVRARTRTLSYTAYKRQAPYCIVICSLYGSTILSHSLYHSVPQSLPYCPTLSTIQSHTLYHTVPHSLPYCPTHSTIPSHTLYHTVPQSLPYCPTLSTIPFHTLYHTVPHYLINDTIFGGGSIEHKMCFYFLCNNYLKQFSFLK